jgi:hypothetical protein
MGGRRPQFFEAKVAAIGVCSVAVFVATGAGTLDGPYR